MNIELAKLSDDRILFVSDRPMPDIVKRVEYYRDQKLFMLCWYDQEMENLLMQQEVPIDFAMAIEKTPSVIVYSLYPDHQPIGYKVPLVKIGDLY